MPQPKPPIFQQVHQEVREIVGDTNFLLKQTGGRSFSLTVPAGTCWRSPGHPKIQLAAEYPRLTQELRTTLGLM